ncbi:hypothetical protein QWZ10_16925 [Paracoccus cavernae]|uniref:Uncharacterized protein n=1 Tax=Paracoccus cavernae TaxID=1571207 RepID=A0ABT8D8B1_9RHOB|nr:hypothetical protein [Paracoccus cavernae]
MAGKSGLGLTIGRAGRLAYAASSGPAAWRGSRFTARSCPSTFSASGSR